MEYGLLPVEACVSFLILLFMMYNQKAKTKEKTSTSVAFKAFMVTTIIYGLSIIISIVLMKYTPIGDGIVFRIIWRVSYILLLYAIAILYIYGFATVHKIKETNFFKMLFYNIDTKFITAETIIVSLLFCMPITIKGVDFINKNNIIFINTRSAFFMIGLLTIASLFYLFKIFKFRKEMTKEFIICDIFSFLIVISNFGIHVFYHESSLMIVPLMLINFMFYYLIENPDIKLIDEEKKLNQEFSSNTANKIDLFDNINSSLNNTVDEIKVLSKQIKQIEDDENKIVNVQKLNKKCQDLLEDFENIFKNISNSNDITVTNEYEMLDLVTNIRTHTLNNLQDKKVKLLLNVSPNLCKKYYGDFEKINNTILSIVSYCCKYVTLGRVTINITSTRENDKDTLVFKIIDTSNGLTNEEYENIFETNSQLNICNKYIEMMGGTLIYKTEYRLGNTFIIKLNQKISDSTPLGDINATKTNQIESIQNKDYSKNKILIVDDDINNSNLTKRILSKYKLDIKIVNSSSECIDLIKVDEKFDMIFMDILMKDIDGVETLKILKDLEGYTLPKIIALTANALPGMKEKYLSDGFDDYIAKPMKKTEIERVINKFLN